MRYLGGKSRIGNYIGNYINSIRKPDEEYWEPFCGALNVTRYVKGQRFCTDASISLICLLQAVQKGWEPPDVVSEGLYQYYHDFGNPTDPMTGFIGYGCSFGGKWFGGYARYEDTNFAAQSKKSLLAKMRDCQDCVFEFHDYQYLKPEGKLIYCDPPYDDTEPYDAPFDHQKFWNIMREWSKINTVLISEYKAPEDFMCIMELETFQSVSRDPGTQREQTTERLFIMKGSPKR